MEVSSLLSEEAPKTIKPGPPKSISFELLLDEGSKTRARIPLRVLVNTHDTTDSIITTVKNFYGIYQGNGVSFEDAKGRIVIASYDNLTHDTTVYVRSIAMIRPPQTSNSYQYPPYALGGGFDAQPRPSLGEPFQMLPPHMREQSHSPSRSSSRLARKRSISPLARGRRSGSQQKGSQSVASRGSSASGSYREDNGYSDSEAGRSSVSGSRRGKSEQFASSDISTANVLQDGRRGHAIFDSSTLPLFVPPQVPVAASQSSVSPQRRSNPQEIPSPFQLPAQKLYNVTPALMLSPQSYGNQNSLRGTIEYSVNAMQTPVPQHGHRLRDRSSIPSNSYNSRGGYPGSGILPTPDPTVASCISDEDVARTLIALGDASNYSHGRTSNSTIDDTFSGVADAASSTGATSDSDEYSDNEGGLPKHRKYLDDGDDEYGPEGVAAKTEHDEFDGPPKTKKIKTKLHDGPTGGYRLNKPSSKSLKGQKVRSNTLPKPSKGLAQSGLMKAPTTAASATQRKASNSSFNFQHQLGADEEDLSSKPRCQRCRKSKKGCDRQRPCQRCKDAGIGIEGCVSEDEGNGRKGRYGRHMGVPVKKDSNDSAIIDDDADYRTPLDAGDEFAPTSPDKNKKRKR